MNIIEEILSKKRENQDTRFQKFGLTHNPFPKSGTANVNETSDSTKELVPIDDDAHKKIAEYVADSLYSSDDEDQKLVCTITGDYGTGKTQLLLYTNWLIQSQPKKAYTVYINNPGEKLSELIGSVIESIGKEQFKKYIWGQIIDVIKSNKNGFKDELMKTASNKEISLFEDNEINPFSAENEASHKAFLDSFLTKMYSQERKKEFNKNLKNIILQILESENSNDSVIANYFYNLVSEDLGINKTWETITSGTGQYLDTRVVKLLNAIIKIIHLQGFERFYLLVDEFEDITSGRLTKKEVDSYTHNLRTLIDKERSWCLILAMTSDALIDLKKMSPPLVDRLTDREIKIERLSKKQVFQIFKNYLNLARKENKSESILPFTKEVIEYINSVSQDLPRLVLRKANYLMERAADILNTGEAITLEFAKEHLQN